MKIKKRKSVALIVSAILGVLYSGYIIVYFSGTMFGASSAGAAIGGAIATALVTPHMVCVVVAAIFNTVACFTNKAAFALVGGILYSVGAVVFLVYALFVVPSIILSFVGYGRLRKFNAEAKRSSTAPPLEIRSDLQPPRNQY